MRWRTWNNATVASNEATNTCTRSRRHAARAGFVYRTTGEGQRDPTGYGGRRTDAGHTGDNLIVSVEKPR
jgi:hypothetical protein